MYNIAVMGDRDSIYGFAALGLEIFPYYGNEQDAVKQLRHLCEGNYAIIYITEALAEILEDEIDKVRENPLPAIILIPGVSGNTGKGMKSVKISVEQAVGSDIIFNG
ncbi:MAG: V-type ATP synthase subunit F [Oscillospiraceae bacterium]|nr:V-type ATP synthase subunit F [Oscillospiraceae bacterium]